MRTPSIAAALLIALTPAAVAVSAFAQAPAEDPTIAAARARFKEGVDFYDKGQFEQSRAAFLQAYALKKHPDVLFNLAWSSLKSDHSLEATKYFKQFLAEAQDIPPAKRAEAEKGLAEARAKLGRIEVIAAAGTEVTIDGESAGKTPLSEPVTVEPGAHTVKFKAVDGTTDTQSVSVLAGDKSVAKFGAPQATTPPPPPPPAAGGGTGTAPPPPPPPSATATPPPDNSAQANTGAAFTADTGPKKNWLAPPKNMLPVFIGAGAAVVGFGVGIGVGVIAKGQAQDNKNSVESTIRQNGGHDPTPTEKATCAPPVAQNFSTACQTLQDDMNKVNADATIGNIGLAVGLVATAGTIGYYLFATKKDAEQPATGRPVLTPIVGPRVSGLSISGEF
jgi:hypothetical protein